MTEFRWRVAYRDVVTCLSSFWAELPSTSKPWWRCRKNWHVFPRLEKEAKIRGDIDRRTLRIQGPTRIAPLDIHWFAVIPIRSPTMRNEHRPDLPDLAGQANMSCPTGQDWYPHKKNFHGRILGRYDLEDSPTCVSRFFVLHKLSFGLGDGGRLVNLS